MTSDITSARAGEAEGLLFDTWFDPIEDGLRAKVRGFIEAMIEETVLPSAETAAMLFWALLASGQVRMRKVDGWPSLATPVGDQPVALAA